MRYLFFLLIFASCTHHYYAPNTVQTPYLRDQHDATIAGGLGSGDEFSGSEIHAVYSPVKHGAIMVNHFNAKSKNQTGNSIPVTDDPQWGRGRLTEVAIGGYYPFNGGSASIFSGYGKGFVENYYGQGIFTNLKFQRLFIQPTLAFRYGWFDVGLAIRINHLRYLSGDVDLRLGSEHLDELNAIRSIEDKTNIVFPELGLNMGLRVRMIYVKAHLTMLTDTSVESLHFARTYGGLSFGINVQDILESGKE